MDLIAIFFKVPQYGTALCSIALLLSFDKLPIKIFRKEGRPVSSVIKKRRKKMRKKKHKKMLKKTRWQRRNK